MLPPPCCCAFLALCAAADPASSRSSYASWPSPWPVPPPPPCGPMPLRHGGRRVALQAGRRPAGEDGGDVDAEADGDGDVDVDVDVGGVTDEEVLLACRSYLSRTHRLEWTERERRREGAASVGGAAGVGQGAGHLGVGHFWDDADELPYLFHSGEVDGEEGPVPRDDDSAGGEEEEEDDDDDGGGEDRFPSDWGDDGSSSFSGYPQRAPREHVVRSEAARKTWSDPEWRAKWYAKRWGDDSDSNSGSGGSGRRRVQKTADHSGDSRMRAKMSSLPPDVLRSPELGSLSEDELSDVIRTYVVANRRRSRTRKLLARDPMRWRVDGIERAGAAAAAGGRDADAATATPSFEPSEDALREVQRRRSEKATRAYRTRLANLAKKKEEEEGGDARGTGKTSERHAKELPGFAKKRSSRTSPHQEAVRRVEAALDGGDDPRRADVEMILEPDRLGRRREVLQRVLRERFDLMGRCIPSPDDDDDDDSASPKLLFASRCAIGLLGDFVLGKLDGIDAERGGKSRGSDIDEERKKQT